MDIRKNQFSSIEQVTGKYLKQSSGNKIATPSEVSFKEIFEQKKNQEIGELTFSKHASGRLSHRNIRLTDEQMERLETGTKKASQKGIKESLVLVDELAFIVNTSNKTVITAMDSKDANENIYTNIDGAVII